jgi:hypothetical protein
MAGTAVGALAARRLVVAVANTLTADVTSLARSLHREV